MVELGIAASPIGASFPGDAPGERIPDEIRNLSAGIVEESHRPRIRQLTRLKLGPHKGVGAIVVGLSQVNLEVSWLLGTGGIECQRTNHQQDCTCGPGFHVCTLAANSE